LVQAEANRVRTQLDVDRYRPLVEKKAVTQQEYDNAFQANLVSKAQVESAKAGVDAAIAQLARANAEVTTAKAGIATANGQLENAKAAVNTAVLNLGFTRITSPIDGIVGIAQAQVGNLVSAASAPLTTVSTVDPIKVFFTLSEQEYLGYAKQSESLAQLQLELVLADGTTYPEKGSFYFADRQVDPKTGAIRVAGLFPNAGNVLRPGQYGRVRAITATKESALLVPQRAVTELQGTYQVAVVGTDNKVTIRTVKVGERSGPNWVVEEGLQSGDVIVAEGTLKVRPGMVVTPKPFVTNKTAAS
jgi:membrane fusion protein (multidrug efflux system)